MENHRKELSKFYDKYRRMPTYAEMQKLFSYKSKSAVNYAVKKLIDSGFISKDSSGKLIPNSLGSLKVLGLVEAGFPSHAEETLLDTMSLDEYLIENKEASYLLKVKGDSMIDAGIHEGDLLIVERGKNARSGDIVIADVDGEYTVKYYRKEKNKMFLEPANKKFKKIYPKDSLNIIAVVTAVIRKY